MGISPVSQAKIAPAIAIPMDIPTCLTVAIMADPVLRLSLGTEPMTELLFGEENMPSPKPRITKRSSISSVVDSGPSRLSRKRAREIKVIPAVQSILEPILSEIQPLTGPTIRVVAEMTAKSSPACAAERPSPSNQVKGGEERIGGYGEEHDTHADNTAGKDAVAEEFQVKDWL